MTSSLAFSVDTPLLWATCLILSSSGAERKIFITSFLSSSIKADLPSIIMLSLLRISSSLLLMTASKSISPDVPKDLRSFMLSIITLVLKVFNPNLEASISATSVQPEPRYPHNAILTKSPFF